MIPKIISENISPISEYFEIFELFLKISPDIDVKLLAKLPKDVTVHVTYDIFKMNVRNGLKSPVMDYSISADVPGDYFVTEVKAAKEAGTSPSYFA